MDGVVIFVARDRSRAIVWCSDHGPLGLARRDAMPPASQPPLTVGDVVRFEAIDDAGLRLCGRLVRVNAPPVEGLDALLRRHGLPAPPAPSTPERVPHLRLAAVQGRAVAAGKDIAAG